MCSQPSEERCFRSAGSKARPELLYPTAKLATLMPFGKVAAFLGEVLPLSTKVTPGNVRNRTFTCPWRIPNS